MFWGGREGTEAGIAKDPRDAIERYREAIDVLCEYAIGQGARGCRRVRVHASVPAAACGDQR